MYKKVSCMYPEVHDRLKKQTFPAPLKGVLVKLKCLGSVFG